jgi:hypothetical protein
MEQGSNRETETWDSGTGDVARVALERQAEPQTYMRIQELFQALAHRQMLGAGGGMHDHLPVDELGLFVVTQLASGRTRRCGSRTLDASLRRLKPPLNTPAVADRRILADERGESHRP